MFRTWAAVGVALSFLGCAKPSGVEVVTARQADAISAAGPTWEHKFLYGMRIPEVVKESRYDIVVATVEDVSDRSATNARPPNVTLRIHEVLRGDASVDRRQAIWLPFPHDVDYGDVESEPRYKAWAATPLAGPNKGQKMLLFGHTRGKGNGVHFEISPVARLPYSSANRDLVTTALQDQATK